MPLLANRSALPDSLITEDKVYEFTFSDTPLAERIMMELRKKGKQATHELDITEGDLYYNTGRFIIAASFYKNALAAKAVKQMYEDNGFKFFLRDADNILQAECVVLIGTRSLPQGLDCGHCGYEHCGDRKKGVPCAINSVDVGIAIGSACSVAADHRVDTRVMFSAGLAAQQLDWLDGCTQVYAIPVSASSKNPFFDRKPKTE